MTARKVSCLGPCGSYSALAAETLCKGYERILCANFPQVIEKLLAGEVDCAVIPIENSIQGGVLQNLDLLEREEVFAVEETVLKIDHRLALKEGVRLCEVKRVYSHEQAIGQCSKFLQKNLPQAQYIFTDSTAKSLELIGEDSAGIVGGHISANGIVLSQENIADEKCNYTRFLRLVRKENCLPAHSDMVFLCAACAHKAGALLKLLQAFAEYGLNLTRIESRPMKDVFGEYRFFIEFAGDIAEERVRSALDRAKQECTQFRILGAYSRKSDMEASGQ